MKPTDALKNEHRIILSVLDAAEQEAGRIITGGKIHEITIRQMLDFFKNFADRCHHAKEENIFFKKMVERGFPSDSGPIRVMLLEHDEGRDHVKNIEQNLSRALAHDANSLTGVAESLTSYVKLLREHISKEDNVLYPMADNIFTPNDQKELYNSFEQVERKEMGDGVHEKYHALALELTKGDAHNKKH